MTRYGYVCAFACCYLTRSVVYPHIPLAYQASSEPGKHPSIHPSIQSLAAVKHFTPSIGLIMCVTKSELGTTIPGLLNSPHTEHSTDQYNALHTIPYLSNAFHAMFPTFNTPIYSSDAPINECVCVCLCVLMYTTAITLYTKFNSYNNSKPLTYLVPGELKQIQ